MPTVVSRCVEVSTAHGITYVASGRTLLQRGVWFLIFLAACGVFGYNFQNLLENYRSEPTSVTTSLQGSSFIAPDLHFCNLLPLAWSRLIDSENLNTEAMRNLMKDIKVLEDLVQLVLPIAGNALFWPSLNHQELFKAAGHLVYQTAVIASRDAENMIVDERFEATGHVNHFSCFRFQTKKEYFELQGTATMLNFILYLDNWHLTPANVNYFNASINKREFKTGEVDLLSPIGLVLFVTPPNTYPHAESPSRVISPGQYSYITVKMEKSMAADVSRSQCQSTDEFVEYFNRLTGNTTRYLKTLNDCKYHKLLLKLMSEEPNCQCIPYIAPRTAKMNAMFPTCANLSRLLETSPYNATLALEVLRQIRCVAVYRDLDRMFQSEECRLENPCTTIDYSLSFSTADWPLSDAIPNVIYNMVPYYASIQRRNYNRSLPGFESLLRDVTQLAGDVDTVEQIARGNFAMMSVLAGEIASVLTEESVSYTLETLISDTGGIAGLYLGMSFLTVLEFFNLFHDFILLKVEEKKLKTNILNKDDQFPDNIATSSSLAGLRIATIPCEEKSPIV